MNTEQIAPPTEEQEQSNDPQNPIQESKAKKFPVVELFGPVIQGEGTQAGQQTMFVRFGYCDYKCKMCDSLHAVLPGAVKKNATWKTALDIFNELHTARQLTGVNWVTFSGGNPLMHDLTELVQLLVEANFMINVETQGTLWQDWLYDCTVITVSPKSWGMGEKFEEDKFRRFIQRINGTRPVCIKVVVFAEQDLEFAYSIQRIVEDVTKDWLYETRGGIAYYLSLGNPYPPVIDDEYNSHENPELWHITENQGNTGVDLVPSLLRSYKRLSEELLADPRMKDFRFLPQLHVLVYGNEAGR